jgi:adenylate cyclase
MKMLQSYRKRDWNSVMSIIEAGRSAADHFKLGGLLDVYCARVSEFRKNPPPDDWDGVFALQTK